MAKKSRKKKSNPVLDVLRRLATWFACGAVALAWLSAGSVWVSPMTVPHASALGLAFPLTLCLLAVSAAVLLCFAWRRMWIPVLGLLGICLTLRAWCPVNLTSPPPKQTFKCMTWNTMQFGGAKSTDGVHLDVLEYIRRSKADIVFLQEAVLGEKYRDKFEHFVRSQDFYVAQVPSDSAELLILSRYPVAGTELVASSTQPGRKTPSQNAIAAKILLTDADTLTAICVHLESTHLSNEQRDEFSALAENPDLPESRSKLKAQARLLWQMTQRLIKSSPARAVQTDALCAYIDRVEKSARAAGREPCILVCGDYNDTPVSYAWHETSRRLSDVFCATANGMGKTYNRHQMPVRIDHAFVSSACKPFAAKVDTTQTLSDHYPVTFYLRRKR